MDVLRAVECDGFKPALHSPPVLIPEIPVHWERLLPATSRGNGGGGSPSPSPPKLLPQLFPRKKWDGGIKEIPVGWSHHPSGLGGSLGVVPPLPNQCPPPAPGKVMGLGNQGRGSRGLGMLSLLGLGWGGRGALG